MEQKILEKKTEKSDDIVKNFDIVKRQHECLVRAKFFLYEEKSLLQPSLKHYCLY